MNWVLVQNDCSRTGRRSAARVTGIVRFPQDVDAVLPLADKENVSV